MRGRKPDVHRNHTRFDSKAHEEEEESPALLLGRKMGCRRAKSRIVEAVSSLREKCKPEEQATRVHMGHDDVKKSRVPAFLRAMFVGHQRICCQRPHLPRDQKQERVRSSEEDCETQDECVEKEREKTQILVLLQRFQVSQRVDGDCHHENRQRESEVGREGVQCETVGEQRVSGTDRPVDRAINKSHNRSHTGQDRAHQRKPTAQLPRLAIAALQQKDRKRAKCKGRQPTGKYFPCRKRVHSSKTSLSRSTSKRTNSEP